MSNSKHTGAVKSFYETHPISEKQILDKLKVDGIDLNALSEDTLQNYDQDHYGGVVANDILASLTGMEEGTDVLDICCGLGGPSRYFAHQHGCKVTGVDLTKSRIEGAKRLTDMCGLNDLVEFECANALDLPFANSAFDIAVSQESFCHIPNKTNVIHECLRVLKSGGRLAFTDVLATGMTTDETRDRLQNEMKFSELCTIADYIAIFENEGCSVGRIDNIGSTWRGILVKRLAMYRSLKDQTVERFGSEHFSEWDDAYSYFVERYATGELSGGRFLIHRSDS